jgi:hypothetical protein
MTLLKLITHMYTEIDLSYKDKCWRFVFVYYDIIDYIIRINVTNIFDITNHPVRRAALPGLPCRSPAIARALPRDPFGPERVVGALIVKSS